MNHRPRKRFSQNFLIDARIVGDLIKAVHPESGDNIVEIGPGMGALTRHLIERAGTINAVEIDRDLAGTLERQFGRNLKLHVVDVLQFDFSVLGERLRVIGNLPYHISTPLLFHLTRYRGRIADIHVMLQKEVVDRMIALPGGRDYGRLSVMLQYRFQMERLFDVGPECFKPIPAVASSIVRLLPLPRPVCAAKDESVLEHLVGCAFSHRRKTLRNALRDLAHPADFDALGIDPGARAETLAVSDFVRLANRISERLCAERAE